MSALLQGMASRASGDLEASRAHLMRGLAIAPRVAYVGEESRLLSELARVELDAGDLAEATRRARSSLALVRSGVGEVDSEVRALHVLAEVALAEDDRVDGPAPAGAGRRHRPPRGRPARRRGVGARPHRP